MACVQVSSGSEAIRHSRLVYGRSREGRGRKEVKRMKSRRDAEHDVIHAASCYLCFRRAGRVNGMHYGPFVPDNETPYLSTK